MTDSTRIMDELLAEADEFIRFRLSEGGLEVPHLVMAVTPDGEVILYSNLTPDVLRSLGEELMDIADEVGERPALDDTTH